MIGAMDIYHYPKEEIALAQSYMDGILRDPFLRGTELENWKRARHMPCSLQSSNPHML